MKIYSTINSVKVSTMLKDSFNAYEELKVKVAEALDIICQGLIERNLVIGKVDTDGRVNSKLNEGLVLSCIKEICDEEEIGFEFTADRDFCDFKIYGVPVNLKMSSLNTGDNVASSEALLYTIIGERTNGRWGGRIKALKEYVNHENLFWEQIEPKDYYFLVVNKNDTTDIFWTSMRSLTVLRPNGNNLPFQCEWGKNREMVERTIDESNKFLWSAYMDSLKKRYEDCKNMLSEGLEIQAYLEEQDDSYEKF